VSSRIVVFPGYCSLCVFCVLGREVLSFIGCVVGGKIIRGFTVGFLGSFFCFFSKVGRRFWCGNGLPTAFLPFGVRFSCFVVFSSVVNFLSNLVLLCVFAIVFFSCWLVWCFFVVMM